MFRESYRYYYLLGMSCLHTGDYAGAYSYLQRAVNLESEPAARLGLAAVFLRRRQTDEALRVYLDILEQHENNQRAKRALEWLREVESPEETFDWFDSGRIKRILPPIGPFVPRRVVLVVFVLAAAILLFINRESLMRIPELVLRQDSRSGSEFTQISPDTPIVDDESTSRYVLSEREIEALFADMRRDFDDRRDNRVRLSINRIVLSNATEQVKARARYLLDFLEQPTFTSFGDGFEFQEVAADPPLFDGVYVRWRGRVANLVIGEETISFDLLVGYESGQVLLGTIPSRLDFTVLLRNNDPVELIGRVRSDLDPFSLETVSIRVLSPGEIAN